MSSRGETADRRGAGIKTPSMRLLLFKEYISRTTKKEKREVSPFEKGSVGEGRDEEKDSSIKKRFELKSIRECRRGGGGRLFANLLSGEGNR